MDDLSMPVDVDFDHLLVGTIFTWRNSQNRLQATVSDNLLPVVLTDNIFSLPELTVIANSSRPEFTMNPKVTRIFKDFFTPVFQDTLTHMRNGCLSRSGMSSQKLDSQL